MPADKLDQKSEKRNQQSETFPQFQPLNSDQPTNKNHHTTTSKAALQHHGNLPDAAPKSPGDDQGTTQTRFLSAETTIILPAGRNGQKVKSQKGTESEYFPTPFPNPAPLIQANVVLKSHHLPSESAIGASTESIKCSTPRTNQTQTRPSINLKPRPKPPGLPPNLPPIQEPSTQESTTTTGETSLTEEEEISAAVAAAAAAAL